MQQESLPNLTCGVCGAPALGYNFDQVTCESCKAFFRRNALRDMVNSIKLLQWNFKIYYK